jgi:hypothetical protein
MKSEDKNPLGLRSSRISHPRKIDLEDMLMLISKTLLNVALCFSHNSSCPSDKNNYKLSGISLHGDYSNWLAELYRRRVKMRQRER